MGEQFIDKQGGEQYGDLRNAFVIRPLSNILHSLACRLWTLLLAWAGSPETCGSVLLYIQVARVHSFVYLVISHVILRI